MPINAFTAATPKIKIELVKVKPTEQINKPQIQIKPSSSSKPKAVTKIPIAGIVLVKGTGIIIEIAINAIALPNKILPGKLVQI